MNRARRTVVFIGSLLAASWTLVRPRLKEILTVVIALIAIVWFVSHFWLYIRNLSLAIVFAAGIAALAWKGLSLRHAVVLGILLFALFGARAVKSAYFYYHMPLIEQEFCGTANSAPNEVEYSTRSLNYYGALDQVLAKRDRLLRKCGFELPGSSWWTSTDRGTTLGTSYVWSDWTFGKLILGTILFIWLVWAFENRRLWPQMDWSC